MEEVLKANDHKGGWENDSPLWLCAKLMEEVGELAQLVHEKAMGTEELEKEAADVANIALMLYEKSVNWNA